MLHIKDPACQCKDVSFYILLYLSVLVCSHNIPRDVSLSRPFLVSMVTLHSRHFFIFIAQSNKRREEFSFHYFIDRISVDKDQFN